MRDWRKAIRTPISYSVPGSSSNLIRQQTNFVSFVIITGTFVLLTIYIFAPISSTRSSALEDEHGHQHERPVQCKLSNEAESIPYNNTYPLTSIETLDDGRLKYRLAVVADLDKKSRQANKGDKWISYMLYGELIFDPYTTNAQLKWDADELKLSSDFSSGGRGMELSDLVVFNGHLYTCDDRTGIVYEVQDKQLIPWVILRNGNGQNSPKGFKCEWMLVKDEYLYVGGLGKEWTSPSGDVVLNHDPQWVKRISPNGHVEHIDWRPRYLELLRTAGIYPPGYLIHEAAVWSSKNKQWYFLPRRASKESYNDELDEQRGTNILLSADESFNTLNLTQNVGPLLPTHGFSSVKLVPLPREVKLNPSGSEIAIALKSEEDKNLISTYATVLRLPDGHVILPEMKISSKHKYEGVEFI